MGIYTKKVIEFQENVFYRLWICQNYSIGKDNVLNLSQIKKKGGISF